MHLNLRLDTVLPYKCVTIRNFMHGVLLLPSLKKQRELIQGPIIYYIIMYFPKVLNFIAFMFLF